MRRLMMATCIIATLAHCTTPTRPQCAPTVGPSVAVFTLFMGRSIPGRKDLTEQEWQGFLQTVVTPNLPNGFTVFDANGAWMNPDTRMTINEATKVLLVALPVVPDSLAAINRIRAAYKARFQQQLVGMTVAQACGVF